ncbi:MAG: DNA methyltransferase [Planctomycetaceae bacterium]|nr:DNA methyltransferase [Planctomycetaceae bacterium]
MATKLLRLHAEAHRVPSMAGDQEREFRADIQERGIRVPLEVIDGRIIIDGRSRWLAAKRLGIARVPVVAAPLNGDSPVLYMLRAATKRRHLTDDQRACLAREEMEYLATISRRERARRGGLAGGRGRAKMPDSSAGSSAGELSRDRTRTVRTTAAAAYGVSERKIRAAQRLRNQAPALYERVKSGEQRLAVAQRQAERAAKRRMQRQLERQARAAGHDGTWEIRQGDCLAVLAKLTPASVRLIFADPPYNQGVDYGGGPKADRQPEQAYLAWCRRWMQACARVLTDDGSLWVMISDEYADHFGILLREVGLVRRSWIKWYETFGVNCTNNFNRCSRHLLYCVKDANCPDNFQRSSRHIFYCVKHPKRFVFHADAVTRPSDRAAKYADKRSAPGGKLWDNVWCLPRLVENSAERLPDFPTQLPLAVVRPIVQCASDPGDLIVDPFSGSGTTGVAAVESRRRFLGIERNPRFARASRQRISGVGRCRVARG